MTNIDDTTLKLKGLQLNNNFDNFGGLMKKIGEFYKKEAMSKVYKLLGNLTIIGSPVTLF